MRGRGWKDGHDRIGNAGSLHGRCGDAAWGLHPEPGAQGGPDHDSANVLVKRFCEAILTMDPADERELFSDEIRSMLERANGSGLEHRDLLTSAGPSGDCRSGKIRGFGYHDGFLAISAELKPDGAMDRMHLTRAQPPRIDDIVYDNRRLIGDHKAGSLKMALRTRLGRWNRETNGAAASGAGSPRAGQ